MSIDNDQGRIGVDVILFSKRYTFPFFGINFKVKEGCIHLFSNLFIR